MGDEFPELGVAEANAKSAPDLVIFHNFKHQNAISGVKMVLGGASPSPQAHPRWDRYPFPHFTLRLQPSFLNPSLRSLLAT